MNDIRADNIFVLPLERNSIKFEDLPGGLMVPGVIPAADLEATEIAYRNADRAVHGVVFEERPDPDQPDGPGNEPFLDNADWWRAALNFPRDPTLAECDLWQRWHANKLEAEIYYAVQDLRTRPKPPVSPQASRPVRPAVPPVKTGGPTA